MIYLAMKAAITDNESWLSYENQPNITVVLKSWDVEMNFENNSFLRDVLFAINFSTLVRLSSGSSIKDDFKFTKKKPK